MISIKSSLSELEQSHRLRAALIDCYVLAIKNIAQYAVELDEEFTQPHRKYLTDLATEVSAGAAEALTESRATLRNLLRDYRDKASQYLSNLRDELAGSARTLEEILESLGQTDGDHDRNLSTTIRNLREIAATPGHEALGTMISTAADSIECSLEEVRKQHQLTTSQFLVEIRMLHKRIDALETAAAIDELTRFTTREEFGERIRAAQAGDYCLLLVGARGLRRAQVQFGQAVAGELSGAFAKRLRNSLPVGAIIGRWGAEDFAAILTVKKSEAMAAGKWITEHLSGAYACLDNGKTVRPSLQLNVGIVETSAQDSPERILQRIGAFLVGQP